MTLLDFAEKCRRDHDFIVICCKNASPIKRFYTKPGRICERNTDEPACNYAYNDVLGFHISSLYPNRLCVYIAID